LYVCLFSSYYGPISDRQFIVSVVAVNATVTALSPITDDITDALNTAIVDVKALVSLPVDQILADVNGILTVSEVASLVCYLLTVSNILKNVLSP
jgi:hypothetical protein